MKCRSIMAQEPRAISKRRAKASLLCNVNDKRLNFWSGPRDKESATMLEKRSNKFASAIKKIKKKPKKDKKSIGSNIKTSLIAQEVKFARLLASNDKKVRDKVLKNLKKWLLMRSQSSFAFAESDFMRLWKGLFYCMWMSDKPLVQEELAESLSKIIHCFNSMDTALLYTKCTLKSLAIEWFGIDRYRIDKFEMLAKRILRQTFQMCKKQSWNKEWIVGVGKVIEEILLDPKTCLGLSLYITEVYMEELAKISRGKISESIVTEFIKPFIIHLATVDDQRQITHIVTNIFRYLIFQSDIGMDYTEKFNAWKQAGFPCKNIDEIQKVDILDYENKINDSEQDAEDDNDIELNEIPLDPRAGRVNVDIPQLPFNAMEIATLLKEHKFDKSSTTKSRKSISRLISEFTKLHEGIMPLGIKEIQIPESAKVNHYEAADKLLNFEQELYSDSSKNSRKRKKNGNITKYKETFDNIEELIVPQDHNNFLTNSNKKLKLDKNNHNIEDNEKFEDIKLIKQNKKLKKKFKTFKKDSKKLNNTFSECIEEYKTIGIDSSAHKGSTSCNWNVDIPTSSILTPSSSVKKLEKKKATKIKVSPKKKVDSNKLKNNVTWPVLVRLEEQNKTPDSVETTSKQSSQTNSAKKRVKIMLQGNEAYNLSQYIHRIRQSPAIPYDANRNPKAGVLKPSPLPSPINPFYKRKIL